MKDVLHKAQFKPEDAPMFGEQLGLESDEIQYIQRKFKGDAVKIQDSILRAWHRSGLKKERITWEVFVHSLVNCSYSCDVELISGSIPDISHHDKLKGKDIIEIEIIRGAIYFHCVERISQQVQIIQCCFHGDSV